MKTIFNQALSALVILFVGTFFNASLHAADPGNGDAHTTLARSGSSGSLSFDWSDDEDGRHSPLPVISSDDEDAQAALTEFLARHNGTHDNADTMPSQGESDGSGGSRLSERILARAGTHAQPAEDDEPNFMRALFRRRRVRMPDADDLEINHRDIQRLAQREERDAHDLLNMTSLGATALGAGGLIGALWHGWHTYQGTHAARAAARGLAGELAGMEGIATELSTLDVFSDNAVAIGKAGLKVAPYIAALLAMGWGYRKVRSFLMDDAEIAREKAMVALEFHLEQILERFGIIETDLDTLGRGLAEIGDTAEQGADIAAKAYGLVRTMDTGERVLLPVIRESYNNTNALARAIASFAHASKKDRARPLAEIADGIVVNTGTMMASIDTTLASINGTDAQGRRRRRRRRVRAATVDDGERPGTSGAAGVGGDDDDDDDTASVATNRTFKDRVKGFFGKGGNGGE